MKGRKDYEDKRYKWVQGIRGSLVDPVSNCVMFTYLDLVPTVMNRENFMKWIADSKWVDGLVIKYIGDNNKFLDDYIQEIYLMIFNKADKLISVYEDRGILAMVGYMKVIIFTNCFAEGAQCYNKFRRFSDKITKDVDMTILEDTYSNDFDMDDYAKFNFKRKKQKDDE